MSLEQQILDRLDRLYPHRDTDKLLTQCKDALGEPEPAADSTKWSERDAVLICYPDQIADGDRAPLAVLENILQEIFKEKRFNSWCVGEIHILDNRIMANGRRDNFENKGKDKT